MATRTQSRKVLVLAREPMTAALLGMLLEMEGYDPAFAQHEETAEAALARVKPLLVVLLEDALDVAKSDLFLARAARREVGVVLFGGRRPTVGPPDWVQTRRLPWFRMPVDGSELRRCIEQSTASYRLLRTATDRRRPTTETLPDGGLVYLDRAGQRWRVYDRRGADRRQAGSGAVSEEAAGDRTFVNEAGEEWHLAMTAEDFLDHSPTGLEAQLARATRR